MVWHSETSHPIVYIASMNTMIPYSLGVYFGPVYIYAAMCFSVFQNMPQNIINNYDNYLINVKC